MSEKPNPLLSKSKITPRIIIHGGAGNITRSTVPKDRYDVYQASLRRIVVSSAELLSKPGATALDVATHAVSLLEDDPLYNSGHGAVFTLAGKNELESSIMVSNGYRKRGVSCTLLRHTKNPVKLARELLIRGEEVNGGGAKDHCEYGGEWVEDLGKKWGIEMVDPSYFFTQRKWDEHMRGLKEEELRKERGLPEDEMSEWEKENFISLGTCGAVVLDSFGTICTATSTGGLTNKVPGRIGDTPTMGAGYWAEEWFEDVKLPSRQMVYKPPPMQVSAIDSLSRGNLQALVGECLPSLAPTTSASSPQALDSSVPVRNIDKPSSVRHAVGLSSSGNGDTFMRMCASHATAAKSRFTPSPLSSALTWMTGPGGELQKSAGDRWGKVHEGVGGMIGIEIVGNKGEVVCDYNCGGMFRAWTEEDGEEKCLIFREDDWESGPEKYGVL